MPDRAGWAAVTTAAAALAGTALVAALLLWAGGYDPMDAAAAMWSGAFGSTDALVWMTLVRSVPFILTGLAIAVAFRAGVWNIGAEGQLYVGAIAAVCVGLNGGGLPSWILVPSVLVASAVGGALWALVPALMRLRLGVGEVITTILMNFVGINLAAYLVHGPLQESRGVFPQTDAIVQGARLPALVPGTRLHVGFALGVGLALALAFVFRRTRVGFRVRAVGASERASRVAGRIDTGSIVMGSFLASGALAGLAGGVEIAGLTYALYEGLSPGWGYTAIAVALLAALDPVAVLGTAILFGALEAGSGAMQRQAGIPAVWVVAIEALVILAVLATDQARRRLATARRSRATADGGEPHADAEPTRA